MSHWGWEETREKGSARDLRAHTAPAAGEGKEWEGSKAPWKGCSRCHHSKHTAAFDEQGRAFKFVLGAEKLGAQKVWNQENCGSFSSCWRKTEEFAWWQLLPCHVAMALIIWIEGHSFSVLFRLQLNSLSNHLLDQALLESEDKTNFSPS